MVLFPLTFLFLLTKNRMRKRGRYSSGGGGVSLIFKDILIEVDLVKSCKISATSCDLDIFPQRII